MGVLICSTCGVEEPYEGDRPRRTECFKHHLKGMHLGFSYGKEDFHGPTIRERQQQQLKDAAEAGRQIEPIGNRWV